jgi:hypothetical protein
MPPPPCGMDSKDWDSQPLPIGKALMACTCTTEVEEEGNLLCSPPPPCGTVEVEEEGTLLCPPPPPCGRECKAWDYPLLHIRKASLASMGYPQLRAR